ncbi:MULTISPECIES: hypothetical protein [unclassified Crossiella]|uniref:hypothetical protein n=1 Tax=unclassified Crossiella TaxID=2620835 RepID=UPI001FFE872E|nr:MULTISPECIES: hypothetical protein [unclassified Crossiella]MCK2243713.1 hypothetical protein [Crossiella sp. S99.2]MCK2257572.1 hypothetical protein [Crossiella sp. S99.1]
MRTTQLRAAESRAEEIGRLWDNGLTGREIGEKLGLAPKAVNHLLRVTRTDPPRRTWTWLAGPRRIAAVLWLHQRYTTMSLSDLARITGRSRPTLRQCLKEDPNQWSDEEKAQARQQFPDPFDLGTVTTCEREAWKQVAHHEATLPKSRSKSRRALPFPSSGRSRPDDQALVLRQHQRGVTADEAASEAGTSPRAETCPPGSPTVDPNPYRPTASALRARRLVEVTVFSTKNRPAQLSREDQVRVALTAWHLRHQRHFTTTEVAHILGHETSAIGRYLRVLKPHTSPPLTGEHRANTAKTCNQLWADGGSSHIASEAGRSSSSSRQPSSPGGYPGTASL